MGWTFSTVWGHPIWDDPFTDTSGETRKDSSSFAAAKAARMMLATEHPHPGFGISPIGRKFTQSIDAADLLFRITL